MQPDGKAIKNQPPNANQTYRKLWRLIGDDTGRLRAAVLAKFDGFRQNRNDTGRGRNLSVVSGVKLAILSP